MKEIYPELKGQRIQSIKTQDDAEQAKYAAINIYVETDDFSFMIQATYEGVAEIKDVNPKEKKEKILTIICNKGVHPIPEDQLPGEIFVATEGSLPMEHEPLREAVKDVLKGVAEKIHELKPQKVFLVPSGLPVVLSQLQALCMQMLSKPAVILQWDREKSEYFEINIIPRDILTV